MSNILLIKEKAAGRIWLRRWKIIRFGVLRMELPELGEQQGRHIYLSLSEYLSRPPCCRERRPLPKKTAVRTNDKS